ncbi:MAG: pirin family protein [Bacteroidales bacterium]
MKIQKIQKIGFQWEMEDPFLFCAHHKDNFPIGDKNQAVRIPLNGRNIGSDFSGRDGFSMYHGETVPGFPMHPHRGFETVTIVLKGLVDHFDSYGSSGRYGNGDVQWLTTGRGCQHSEMFPLVDQENGKTAELFQIWLNLPAKDKFADPAYKMLWSEDIPLIQIASKDNNCTKIRLISGRMFGAESLSPCPFSWANNPENNVGIFLIRLEPEAELTLHAVSKTILRNLYFYEGNDVIKIEDKAIQSSNRIKLSGSDEIVITNGKSESFLLLLEGEPIGETVAQYGPFVMNTEKEIRDAFTDYRNTQFGGWPWDRTDPVHERNVGRIARYADGTIETR